MPVPTEQQLMLDLENEIKEDKDGTLKRRLREALSEQISAIDMHLRRGVVPDEYSRLNTIKQGLQSAEVVLERVWLYYHK